MSYGRFISFIQEQGSKKNPPMPFVGEIVSISPIKVKCHDIILDDDQIYKLNQTYTIGQTALIYPTVTGKYGVIGVVE